MEARAAVMNAVYHRCLSVTTAEAGHTALGRSTNLMSVDAEKLYLVQQYLHGLWMFPVLCLIVLGILVSVVGLSAFAGMGLLCTLLPIQLKLTKMVSSGRKVRGLVTAVLASSLIVMPRK